MCCSDGVSTWAKFDGHLLRVSCYMQKYLSFIMYYGSELLLFTRNYIVYKHFDKSLHVESSDPTCVQNFRPVTLTVFEILGFKLKNKNNNDNKNNLRNELFAISPMLVVQF